MLSSAPELLTSPRRVALGYAPPFALVRLALRRLRRGLLDRAARWFGVVLVVGWGALIALGSHAAELEVGAFVMDALVVSSWSTGLIAALGAARPFADDDTRVGLQRMMAVRGVEARRLGLAYAVATVWRVAVAVAFPALALWVLALMLSVSTSGLRGRALLGAAIVVYALSFSALLGLVVRWVTAWAPSRPRTLLLALVAAPYLLSLIWPAIPSLPKLSSGLARELASLTLGER